jgi:hypothetical protein
MSSLLRDSKSNFLPNEVFFSFVQEAVERFARITTTNVNITSLIFIFQLDFFFSEKYNKI